MICIAVNDISWQEIVTKYPRQVNGPTFSLLPPDERSARLLFHQWHHPMALSETTYQSRKRFLLRLLKRFSKNGTQSFNMSSAWLQKTFGTDYAKMIREISKEYGLMVSKEAVLGWYEAGRVERAGTCREYSFPAAVPPIPSTTPLPSPETLAPDAREFLDVYSRTNLAAIGIDFAYQQGRSGDGRVYTSVTRHSKKHDAPITIEGRPTVEIDIPNAFGAFLIAACPMAEDYLRAAANRGDLYEMLMRETGVNDRSLVKRAFNILLNKKTSLQFRSVDENGWALPQTLEQFNMHRVTKFVSLAFPKFYKWARKQARTGEAYRIGSQMEQQVIQTCQRKLRGRIPAHTMIRKHDALIVAAEFEGLVRETMKRALTLVLKHPSNQHPILFVPTQHAEETRRHLGKEWAPPRALFREKVLEYAMQSAEQQQKWKRRAVAVLNRVCMASSPVCVVP